MSAVSGPSSNTPHSAARTEPRSISDTTSNPTSLSSPSSPNGVPSIQAAHAMCRSTSSTRSAGSSETGPWTRMSWSLTSGLYSRSTGSRSGIAASTGPAASSSSSRAAVRSAIAPLPAGRRAGLPVAGTVIRNRLGRR